MKDFEQFYNEMLGNETLKENFKEASKTEADLLKFLNDNGVEGSVKDFLKFFTEKYETARALSDEELENAAGGDAWSAILSAITGMWAGGCSC